jgi:hypothetical protein
MVAEADNLTIAAFILAWLIPPVGAIMGHVARAQARRRGFRPSALSTWAVALGWAWTVTVTLVTTLIVVAFGAAVNQAAQAVNTPVPVTAPAYASPVPVDTAPQYSLSQQQVIASAKSYLQTEPGFSKAGLIEQLSSKYGEGFSKRLAVFAVNHVKVNWRQQAVYSARSYLKSEPGWSYSGLVDQLHSQYGEQFTLAQAKYAAAAVGLNP